MIGQVSTTGVLVGATVKVELQVAELLQTSVAVKLTVLVPPQMLGTVMPAKPVVVGGPQLSVAVKLEIQVLKVLSNC